MVQDRLLIQMRSMEEFIDKENAVRFVDAFVEQLELDKLGFEIATLKTEGRPAFNPKVFLKLYFYGYLNGLRSSRKLEKEAIRNVELHWLLEGLGPNYHSISDFRKINPKALKTTFKLFVLFLKLCTAKADGRREIDSSQYAEAVEKNGLHYKANKDLYRKRQEINEHIFGTIKRQWGYNHTNLRGLEKVNGEMALIMTVYNMKRAINILGIEKLLEKLKNWKPKYPKG